jgi:hypothetical protein
MREPIRDGGTTPRSVEENRERYRRSNRGGDDMPTRIVFAVIVLAFTAWAVRFWIVGHTAVR